MANYTTGAQRYNARMDKIFSEAKRLNAIYCGHSEHKKYCKCEDVICADRQCMDTSHKHSWIR